jgi:hypothetical protein
MRLCLSLIALFALSLATPTRADDKVSTDSVVPLTRDDVKRMLESWKQVKPRLPLPPLTEEEKKPGGRPLVNNGRMQAYYLPAEVRGGGFTREPDPVMSLDNTFKTELFWIVSRVSNCRY